MAATGSEQYGGAGEHYGYVRGSSFYDLSRAGAVAREEAVRRVLQKTTPYTEVSTGLRLSPVPVAGRVYLIGDYGKGRSAHQPAGRVGLTATGRT